MNRVHDPDDPLLDDFRNLFGSGSKADSENRRSDIFIAEGVLAAEQLLKSGLTIRSALLTPSRAERLSELTAALVDRGIPIFIAERQVLEDVAGFDVHRGVLVSGQRPAPRSLREATGHARRLAVLESINDHENMGSIFRNAAALGVDGIVLDHTSADPLYRRSIRVSLGWAMRVPYFTTDSIRDGMRELRESGFRLVALTPASDVMSITAAMDAELLDDPVAFVLGAEGPGLTAPTMDLCDWKVQIPMSSGVDSLNVATTLAVVASFAAARRGWC